MTRVSKPNSLLCCKVLELLSFPHICSFCDLCIFFPLVTEGKIIKPVRILDSIIADNVCRLNNRHCGTVVLMEILEIVVAWLNGSLEGKVRHEWSGEENFGLLEFRARVSPARTETGQGQRKGDRVPQDCHLILVQLLKTFSLPFPP